MAELREQVASLKREIRNKDAQITHLIEKVENTRNGMT